MSQFHFPPLFPGNPANPIVVASADWRTDDFTPRSVPLHSFTSWIRANISAGGPGSVIIPAPYREGTTFIQVGEPCVADCDTSTGLRILDVFDFLCFQNLFAAGSPYACDCDTSTGPLVCDVFDFICFQNAYAAGCQ